MTPPLLSLKRRTLGALLWSGVGEYGSSAAHLLALLALGWLLPPSDFGLLALAVIFLVFAEGIGEFGVVAAIVQNKEMESKDLDTAFWFNLAVNLALVALTLALAVPITSFLGNPKAASLLRLLTPLLAINALSAVPRALLLKDLNLRRVSAAQLVGELSFGLVGIALAFKGLGVWSLAGAVLARRLLDGAMLWLATDWRPGLAFDAKAFRKLLRFGGPFMASTIIERALLNIDLFVVGRWLGTELLGYYSLASQLAMTPLSRLVIMVKRVSFSAFSIVQEDPGRLKSGLLQGLRYLLTVILPLAACIVVLGPWLLRGVYGDKWELSIGPLQILGAAGVFSTLRLAETPLLALGRPQLRLWLMLLRLSLFVLLVATFGIHNGISGVAASVGGALAITGVATIALTTRILRIPPRNLALALWPPLQAGLMSLSPLVVFLFPWAREFSPWVTLVYAGSTMALIYLAMILRGHHFKLLRIRR